LFGLGSLGVPSTRVQLPILAFIPMTVYNTRLWSPWKWKINYPLKPQLFNTRIHFSPTGNLLIKMQWQTYCTTRKMDNLDFFTHPVTSSQLDSKRFQWSQEEGGQKGNDRFRRSKVLQNWSGDRNWHF
jgi:hypothetical protein